MPELRRVLGDAGFGAVSTYVQSGNAVVTSDLSPADVERGCEEAISAGLGFRVDVVVRDREQLAAVLARDPFAGVAHNQRRYLVVFFRDLVPASLADRLQSLAAESEAIAVVGREAFIWTPESVQRSRLWSPATGMVATARNWTTVRAMHALLSVREDATRPG